MSSKTKQRFRTVAALIVLLALFLTIYRVNEDRKPGIKTDFRKSNKQFDDNKFINKAQISFSTSDPIEAKKKLAQILEEKGKRKILKEEDSNYGAYIYIVQSDLIDEIKDNMREFGAIGSTIEHVDTSLVNLDYESENSKLLAYEAELKDLGNVRFPSDLQNKRKEELHSHIQSARSNLEKLREDDSTLLYITLKAAATQYKGFDQILNYGLIFIVWLAILSAAYILIIVLANVLVSLLSSLGIKGDTAQGYGADRGYYSSYADRKKTQRKVKRVYKDKDAKPDNLEDNNK